MAHSGKVHEELGADTGRNAYEHHCLRLSKLGKRLPFLANPSKTPILGLKKAWQTFTRCIRIIPRLSISVKAEKEKCANSVNLQARCFPNAFDIYLFYAFDPLQTKAFRNTIETVLKAFDQSKENA